MLEECITDHKDFAKNLSKVIVKKDCISKDLDSLHCAEMLLGKCNLSQRAYNTLKKILDGNNIKMVTYEKARNFTNNMATAKIVLGHGQLICKSSECMSVTCAITELLCNIFKTSKLYEMMSFPKIDKQKLFFKFLMSKDSQLYSQLDHLRRTVFLRLTGDNFRAAKQFPTEQI